MAKPSMRSRLQASYRKRPRMAIVAAICISLLLAIGAWRLLRHRPPAPPLVHETTQVIFEPAPRPTTPVAFSEGCVNARCHSALDETPVVHEPIAARACQACHAADTGGHKYPLLRAKRDLCMPCHDSGTQYPVQHAATTEDGCLTCHAPHGAKNRSLLAKATTHDTCSECHQRDDGHSAHPSYTEGGCTMCHELHGAQNTTMLAAGTVTESCRVCHAAIVNKTTSAAHSHEKSEGECAGCHEPHTSPYRGLLTVSTRETCVRCHKDVGTALKSKVAHDAMLSKEDCLRCHDAHGSDLVGMLRVGEEATCLTCHSKTQTASDRRTIPAMEPFAPDSTDPAAHSHRICSGCHSVHGSNYTELLKATSSLPEEPYDRRNYALCFDCHDPSLGEPAGITQFRDGTRNLHDVHLHAGEKSRTCTACHAIHSGHEPRLIAKTVRFEGSPWAMSLDFQVTADGGQCTSGCHEPLDYTRKPGGVHLHKKEKGGTP